MQAWVKVGVDRCADGVTAGTHTSEPPGGHRAGACRHPIALSAAATAAGRGKLGDLAALFASGVGFRISDIRAGFGSRLHVPSNGWTKSCSHASDRRRSLLMWSRTCTVPKIKRTCRRPVVSVVAAAYLKSTWLWNGVCGIAPSLEPGTQPVTCVSGVSH